MKQLLSFAMMPCLAMVLTLFVSCSSDNETTGTGKDGCDSMAKIILHLAVTNSSTRVGEGASGENMKSYVIVITDTYKKVVKVISKNNLSDSNEEQTESVLLPYGKIYNFYSFANISESDLGNLSEGTTVDFESMDFAMHGNDFDAATGIPMSNKQEIEVTSGTTEVSLWVVRMLAKVELQITNGTNSDITINSVSLSDITQNPEGDDKNIRLLPKPVDGKDETACEPNIASSANKSTYTYSLSEETKTVTAGSKQNITFYINESEAKEPVFFELALDTDGGNAVRYAMLDWKQIARNDYRIIPITLDNYKLSFKVEAFTPIGILPDVEDDGTTLDITFGTYGEFHLIPEVTKISDGSVVPYDNGIAAASDKWTKGYTQTDGKSNDDWWTKIYPESSSTDTDIYDKEPEWVEGTVPRIEGNVGNREGYAVHQLLVTLPKADVNQAARTIRYKMQINKTAQPTFNSKTKGTCRKRIWQEVPVRHVAR